MKDTRIIMGMPITIEVVDAASPDIFEKTFVYFEEVDRRFSTYKSDSEISRINRGELAQREYSGVMREILARSEKTKHESEGYFDIKRPDGILDPSGIVKGFAIREAAQLLREAGYEHFYIDAGGDIQSCGKNAKGEEWSVGIRNPLKTNEIVKVVYPRGLGVATSGNYIRGEHIYDPHSHAGPEGGIVSITVIGPDVYEADRFATAAYAMGRDGIYFLERQPGLEGYMIDARGIATMTSGFELLTKPYA